MPTSGEQATLPPAPSQAPQVETQAPGLDIGGGLTVERVRIGDLREQDVNAHYMPPEKVKRLAQTIGRDRRLESLPFVAVTRRGMEIVSGHHRVRASRMAGMEEIYALVDRTGLTAQQIAAKQLAHNAIGGYDDPQLVERILSTIQDEALRAETSLVNQSDPQKVDVPEEIARIPTEYLLMAFCEPDYAKFDRLAKQIEADMTSRHEHLWLTDIKTWAPLVALVSRIEKASNVKGRAAMMNELVRLAAKAYEQEHPEPDASGTKVQAS